MREAVLNLPLRHGIDRLFHVKWRLEIVVKLLNCNSGCVSKDREGFLVGFFAVKARNGFILNKRFKEADVLA